MADISQWDALLTVGALALAVTWVLLAPRLTRFAVSRIRSSLTRDVHAARDLPIEELMPQVLSARGSRIAACILGAIWLAAYGFIVHRVGVSSSAALAYSVFLAALLLLSLIDIDTQLLPGYLVGGVLWMGILASALHVIPLPVEKAVFGAIFGWVLFAVPNVLMHLVQPDDQAPVGEGDVALMAACGAWLGPQTIILAGGMAVVGGLAVRGVLARLASRSGADFKPITCMPFGPLINIAALASLCAAPSHFFVV